MIVQLCKYNKNHGVVYFKWVSFTIWKLRYGNCLSIKHGLPSACQSSGRKALCSLGICMVIFWYSFHQLCKVGIWQMRERETWGRGGVVQQEVREPQHDPALLDSGALGADPPPTPLQASAFPSINWAPSVVFKLCSKTPWGKEESSTSLERMSQGPQGLHPPPCLSFWPGPPLQGRM